MSERHLEDFRLNRYLTPYLAIQKNGPDEAIEMSYNIYAIHAFYSTMEDIKDLEHQATFVNNGHRANVSIALWFLSLESFVNCLCKVICLKDNEFLFSELSGKSIGKRLGFVLDKFSDEGEVLRKSGLIARVNEFIQFRNEIFHDRNTGEHIEFHKTNFSSRPFFSNQVDVFQSLLIFMEVCCAFRYVIAGLDIMPNVSIGHENLLVFDKLDNLYNTLLKPYFSKVLDKHNLTTRLNLSIDKYFEPKPNSNAFFKTAEVLPIFQHQQNDEFIHPLNQEKTTIGFQLYSSVIEASQKPVGHFDSMNFILDWPKMYADAQRAKQK